MCRIHVCGAFIIEIETVDSQTGNVDEAADAPALAAPELDESTQNKEENEEETTAPPEAERHKELWNTSSFVSCAFAAAKHLEYVVRNYLLITAERNVSGAVLQN